MKTGLGLLVLFLLGQRASGQSRLVRVYHVVNADSSVVILGENHGFVSLTVSLSATLVNMHSVRPLPAKIVVHPASEPQLLATLVADRRPYSFRYECPYQLGTYPGHAPDTSHVYRLPFQLSPDAALPPCRTDNAAVPGNRYPYFFALPAGAAVCAARGGTVAALRQDVAKTKGAQANFVVVFHEDGSLAWYQNLQQHAAVVRLGQRVAAGEVLGYLSRERQHPPLYFDVEYPGDMSPQAIPVTFRVGDQLLRPHLHSGISGPLGR